MKKLMTVFAFSAALALPVLSIQAMASGDHEAKHEQGNSRMGHDAADSDDHDHSDHKGMREEKDDEHGHHEHNHHDGEIGPVGLPANVAEAQKTVHVTLADNMTITFEEKLANIKSGTVIEFEIHNKGSMPHEFSISDQAGQQEHAAMMRKMPGMVHNDGNTLTVKPGADASLTWRFEGEGMVVFACNIPGHYEAGMFQKVELKD